MNKYPWTVEPIERVPLRSSLAPQPELSGSVEYRAVYSPVEATVVIVSATVSSPVSVGPGINMEQAIGYAQEACRRKLMGEMADLILAARYHLDLERDTSKTRELLNEALGLLGHK